MLGTRFNKYSHLNNKKEMNDGLTGLPLQGLAHEN